MGNMPTRQVKLAVITTGGKVVGTKQLVGPEDSTPVGYAQFPAGQVGVPVDSTSVPVYARIVAGPGQEKYEVDVDMPEHLFQSMNVAEIHEIAQRKIDQLRAS